MKASEVPIEFQAHMLNLTDAKVYESDAETEKAQALLEKVVTVFVDHPPYLILNTLAVAYEGVMQLLYEEYKRRGGQVDLDKIDLDSGMQVN